LGLRPLEPGFSRYELQPRLGDLGRLHATAHTPLGPFEFTVEPVDEGHRLEVHAPASTVGQILLPSGARPLKPGRNVVLVPRDSARQGSRRTHCRPPASKAL